jgi:potassium channel subfamily K
MNQYVPPIRPQQIYTQGFWYAVIAAIFYLICSMLLMVNMLGYFLGHYPQRFNLTDSQRTLILQTMLFGLLEAPECSLWSKASTESISSIGRTSTHFISVKSPF